MSRIFSRVTFTLILAVVLSTLGASNVFAESPRLGEFTVATVEQMERLREATSRCSSSYRTGGTRGSRWGLCA